MSQPPGFQDKIFPSYVCQLHKSLYALKQGPREWFKRLSSFLHSLNFQGSSTDTSLFFHYHNNTPIFILIYVDDILLIYPSFANITPLIQTLKNTCTMKDLGPSHYFLGIEFLQKSNRCFLSKKNALSIIKKSHVEHTKPVSNPCSFSTSNLSKLISVDPSIYRSTVGALHYLTITFVVNKACQSMHSPTEDDWLKVKHLLRYIKGTFTDSLFYHSQSDFTFEVFSDADWVLHQIDDQLEASTSFLVKT